MVEEAIRAAKKSYPYSFYCSIFTRYLGSSRLKFFIFNDQHRSSNLDVLGSILIDHVRIYLTLLMYLDRFELGTGMLQIDDRTAVMYLDLSTSMM